MVQSSQAPPPAVARYFTAVNPIVANGGASAKIWLRALADVASREDPEPAQAEVQQVALGQARALDDARRLLSTVSVPSALTEMHHSIDRWLKMSVEAREAIAHLPPPPWPPAALERARTLTREAGMQADRYNRERQSVAGIFWDPAASAPRPRSIMSGRETRALAIGLVLGLIQLASVVYGASTATGAPAQSSAALAAAAAANATATAVAGRTPKVDKRVFPPADVLGRLKAEIGTRNVAFNDPDVQLVEPDRIIVKGKVQGASAPIPIEVDLQMSVTADGTPRLETKKLSAVGVQIPPEAFDAVNKRVAEANATLPQQIPSGSLLKKLYVQKNAVVAELEPAAP